jgi:hypothetical protein
MPVYQQMGHDSRNLLEEESLAAYAGAILSPVNYSEEQSREQVTRLQVPGTFDFIFDPQLYYPHTERGVLKDWAYFPSDFDSADQGSPKWMESLVDEISATAVRLGATHACSPVIVPRSYSEEFYERLVQAGELLASNPKGLTPVQSLLVSLSDLAENEQPLVVASIVSRTPCELVYLILVTDHDPRRELNDRDELRGAMHLISLLENAGLKVIVGFSSSDMVLWKAAGATACATGKFFNLRRFTKSRFDEPASGGQQFPYWFEESLLAYLREPDVLHVREEGLISAASLSNPHSATILEILDRGEGEAWLKFSWRHYMYWFADMERRIAAGNVVAKDLLKQAEDNWIQLEDHDVLLDERRNDGGWIRPWRQALVDFTKLS